MARQDQDASIKTKRGSKEREAHWRQALSARGAEGLLLPDRDGRVDLRALLEELGRREVTSVFVEGGAALLGSLFGEGLVDKVYAFIAPKVIGGSGAPSPVGGVGVESVSAAWRLAKTKVEQIGGDVLVVGYPAKE